MSDTTHPHPAAGTGTDRSRLTQAHRAGLSGLLGTAVEWYDFFVFTTASSLVFPQLFFPQATPGGGVLASFATFWVGFLGRPVGAALFGHLGDRYGRKRSLVTSLTLMGATTTGIGLLPTYHAAGVVAPLLLCALRLLQGIAVGGEWGGAVLLAGEHAPREHRTLFTAYIQQGTPVASLLSTAVFLPFSRLADEQFLTWGWRVPFLLAAAFTTTGLLIRLRVAESPQYRHLSATPQGTAAAPLTETLRRYRRTLALCAGACAIPIAGTYLAGTFVLSWATVHLGFPRDTVLTVILCSAAGRCLLQPLTALAAHRYGPARICALGLALYLAAIPFNLYCLHTHSLWWITAGIAALEAASAMTYTVIAALLLDAFPTRIRYTGISLAQQLASLAFGGTAPATAQALSTAGGGRLWPVALYQAALTLLSAASLLTLTRRRRHAGTVKASDSTGDGAKAAPGPLTAQGGMTSTGEAPTA
ncbi:MFS transporter [Streptomyces eurocidicus]|uniref:MFS family permease n=1 Tax=Streptomyces eurocidicus TaxID=66423 RepID=A0A7W8BGD4_STREU|nr:MFS transporter [Streptomyces eurocidicus]MBB5122946.1 MFS family permease [Streptomyces eurocidicus]